MSTLKSSGGLAAARDAAAALKAAGVTEAPREAELLVTEALGVTRAVLYRDDPALSPGQAEKLSNWLGRRCGREPIQYILGHVEFMGLDIQVGPGVLIPRPETELLAAEAIRLLGPLPSPRVLELGAGSGCLALALARGIRGSSVTATENSPEALKWARRNIGAINSIRLLEGSLFEPLGDERFGAVISNPPYIPTDEIEALAPEIRLHEPCAALDGGGDGLSYYRKIVPSAPEYLNEGGFLLLEAGYAQAPEITRMALRAGLSALPAVPDAGGCERVLVFRKGGAL